MCMSCWSDFRCRKQHLQILANKTKKQFVYTLLITPSEQISIYIFSFYHRYDWIMFVCVTERNVTHPSYLSPEGNWENFIQRTQQRNTYPMQIQCCSFDITFNWSFITRHTHTHTQILTVQFQFSWIYQYGNKIHWCKRTFQLCFSFI